MMFATLAAESLKSETFHAVQPPSGSSARVEAAEASLGQSLERYTIRADGKAPETCPQNLASPRRCPFGGACHTCPARAQAKAGRRREIDEPRRPSGSGEPLSQPMLESFQSRFGHDFGQVRVHTDARAAASAERVNAYAFTVGRDIFFGPGEYRPHTPAGLSLLAHELAHVVQQRGGGSAAPEAQDESEANQARDAVLAGRPAPAMAARGVAPRAQDKPLSLRMRDDQLTELEKRCDLSEMCLLRTVYPDQFPLDRVQAAFRKCKPGQIFVGDPCIGPHLPPGYLPGTTADKPKPKSGGLDLAKLTTFKYGPLTVSLPNSVSMRLQAPLRGAEQIEFELKAESSGTFSFSAKLNGLPHVTISVTASADVAGKSASFGLSVATARQRCQAVDPITTREKIKTTGAKVEKTMNELAKAAPGPDRLEKLKDLGQGIYELYDEVDKAKKPCEKVAVGKLGVGVKIPWGDAEAGKPAPSPYVGITGEVNF